MEAAMEHEGSYRPVGFGGAVVEQFRFLWLSRRPILMVLGLLGILALSGEPWADNPAARLFTLWPLWMVVVPPFWAFSVWHNEGPSNRLYLWSQPVSRSAQTLARVAAGALWLGVMYAALLAAGAIFAAFDGELAQFGVVGAIAWLSYFAGPLLMYTIVSVLALASDHPIRWFIALLFGVPIILSLLDEWLGLQDLVHMLLKPLSAPWGIGASVLGPFVTAMAALDAYLDGREPGAGGMAEFFDPAIWWVAMPLWLLLAVSAVIALAQRHPDRYPSLRRSS